MNIWEIIEHLWTKISSNSSSLNSIWIDLGISQFSILFWIKVVFLFIFLALNIWFLYLEYLNSKHQQLINPKIALQASTLPELQKIAKQVLFGLGGLGSIITIKNEVYDKIMLAKREAELQKYKEKLEDATVTAKKVTSARTAENLNTKWNLEGINKQIDIVVKYQEEETELRQLINENKKNVDWSNNPTLRGKIRLTESSLQEIEIKKNRALAELNQDIKNASKLSEEICQGTDEKTILAKINGDDIHKSMLFNLDELWSRFETFDGITKTVCLLMFSDYIIIVCVFSIAINLYGNYLIERFNLEIKYPRVALFIKYRQKLSKFYVLTNLIYILITCLMGLLFGITVLDIIIFT